MVLRRRGSDAWQVATAGEPGHQLGGVEAEPLEQPGVPVGVDLLGELLVGPVGATVVAALSQVLDDRVLVDLH
jgi:hypothetical protein